MRQPTVFASMARGILRGVVTACVGLATVAAVSAHGQSRSPATPCGRCIAVLVTPQQANLLGRSTASLTGLLTLVAVADAFGDAERAAVEGLRRAQADVGLVIRSPSEKTTESLPSDVAVVLLDLSGEPLNPEAAFAAKTAAASLRGRGVARLGIMIRHEQRPQASALGLAAYVDLLVVRGDRSAPAEDEFARTERWTLASAGEGAPAARDLVTLLEEPGRQLAAGTILELEAGAERWAPVLAALAQMVPAGLAPLADVSVACDAACDAAAFLDAESLDAIVVVRPSQPISRVSVRPGAVEVDAIVPERAGLVPQLGGEPLWRLRTAGGTLGLPLAIVSPIVLRVRGWRGNVQEAFSTGVEVTAARSLTVEEIVARHQAARARQESIVESLIAIGTTVLTFDAPGFAAPVTVAAATRIYTSRESTQVEQRDIRVNGLALSTRGDEVPRLPIIEPERVATPPLVITLTDAYRYRLVGEERHGQDLRYVVAFEPRETNRSLLSGRAWIDAQTFGVVRIDATQTALPGPVVSSRQVDDFARREERGVPVWLPVRSEINQRYESASYATPIHRVVTTTTHLVNPPDFRTQLEAAHASDAVMMIDTPQGYRYLRRTRAARGADRERGAPGTQGASGGTATTTRTIAKDRAERVRTLAGGVTWDPNISVPLVFAGLSYLDLNLFGTGAQVDGFFGGTYGRLAWAGPPMGRSGWRFSGDAFGLAISYNDRMFRSGVEQYRENITQRPLHVAAGVVGPVRGAWRLRASYEMDYVRYRRADSTASRFVVPRSTPVHGLRVTLERQRGPWVLSGWWNGAVRQSWDAWGLPEFREPVVRRFQRVGLRATRSLVWSPRAVGRLEVTWMDGHRLDRFSRYAFGTFENPLRGYPSASIRYDRGFVGRSAASWTLTSRLRADLYADLGVVRDPGRGSRVEAFPGLGAGLQFPVPFGLLTAVEWGYGFAGERTDGGRGTQVVRVSAYKVF